jgi:hypothetical protein
VRLAVDLRIIATVCVAAVMFPASVVLLENERRGAWLTHIGTPGMRPNVVHATFDAR